MKAEKLKGKNVELAAGDLLKADTLAKVFLGADTAFVVVSAGEHMVQAEKNAFDAAKKAGVKHVVLLSVMGADTSSPLHLGRWHGERECQPNCVTGSSRRTRFMDATLGSCL
jgi:uncharacterized protein YbjT (DUF2867 family)